MQIAYFPRGGFVAHNVTLPHWKGHFSIWHDDAGKPREAERIHWSGRINAVPKDSAIWDYICRNPIPTESHIAAITRRAILGVDS